MLRILVQNWWLLALRGVFALVFSMLVFGAQTVAAGWLPGAVVLTSVQEAFGLLAVSAGFFTVIAAVRGFRKETGWLLLFLDGVGACVAGFLAIAISDLTFIWLVRLIMIWAWFVGISELLIAYKLRRHVADEWFLALAAGGSLTFGAYLLFWQFHEEHQVLVWLAAFALYSAVAMLGLALRLRKLRSQAHLMAEHASGSQSRRAASLF